MKDSYVKYWRKSLGEEQSREGKLYLFRRSKTDFGTEPYLKHISKLKLRRAFTAFRISAHNLEIETGRYIHNINNGSCVKREDRFCTFCYEEDTTMVMGDETHAVLNCPRFTDMRNRVFGKVDLLVPNFRYLSDDDKIFYLLTCENDCAILVSKLLGVILSTQRPSFIKIWKELHVPIDVIGK